MTTLKNHTSRVFDINLLLKENFTLLYSLSENGEVRKWDFDNGQISKDFSDFLIKDQNVQMISIFKP
jgi:hypothetical protein